MARGCWPWVHLCLVFLLHLFDKVIPAVEHVLSKTVVPELSSIFFDWLRSVCKNTPCVLFCVPVKCLKTTQPKQRNCWTNHPGNTLELFVMLCPFGSSVLGALCAPTLVFSHPAITHLGLCFVLMLDVFFGLTLAVWWRQVGNTPTFQKCCEKKKRGIVCTGVIFGSMFILICGEMRSCLVRVHFLFYWCDDVFTTWSCSAWFSLIHRVGCVVWGLAF